ncbi:MAG: host attachment protein [Pseudomonadota bacterium]
METTWIVTANAGRARIFSLAQGAARPDEIEDMVNSPARMRDSELETDRFGPTSAGKSIHNTGGATPNKTYEPPQTPVEHATELFARGIADYLLQAQRDSRFDKLILSASPQFLGMLRALLNPQLHPLIVSELNKDYTQLDPTRLMEQIASRTSDQ